MRLGLVGLGRIGAFHAGTLTTIPAIDSLVVTDINPERTKHIVDRYGVQGVDSLDDGAFAPERASDFTFAAGDPATALAAVRTGSAALVSRNFARHFHVRVGDTPTIGTPAGLPTLCEKPVARSGAEGAELARRLTGSDVPVQIGFQRRYDAAIAAAKAAVEAGELGWITTVRSTTLDPEPPTPEYVAVSGGMFRDCGVHDFDIIRWVTGQEAVDVYAVGSNRGAEFFRQYADVDTSAAIVTFADGALGVVSNTRYNGRGYDVRLEVHGSKDSVAAGIDPKWPIRSTEPGGPPHRFFMDRSTPANTS